MSTPFFQDFDPRKIPWQWESVKFAQDFDYSTGILETFSSGSVGSAKTIKDIHEIVANCLEHPGSRWLMVRRALKDLKRTSWKVLLQHMADIPHVIKSYNKTDMLITFVNGSEIMGDSYHDEDLTKFQSLELTGVDIEEANECPKDVFDAIKLRVGRIPGVPVNRIQARCNPEGPSHWLYEYFIEQDGKHPNRKVFYSLTEQNPFLPKWYIENLKRDLDPKMAQRKLYGKWVEITKEVVYYNYSSERNFHNLHNYSINQSLPLCISHDFNIGLNKPMSAIVGQYDGRSFHIIKVYHIDGARTGDIIEEVINDFSWCNHFQVYGDASGKNNDTRSKASDYEIINKALSNMKSRPKVEMKVPKANPPLRRRHNTLNACFNSESGLVRIHLYKGCEWLDKGLRLTQFRQGANLIEDDSLPEQHATTALGYWVDYQLNRQNEGSTVIQL